MYCKGTGGKQSRRRRYGAGERGRSGYDGTGANLGSGGLDREGEYKYWCERVEGKGKG